jgi:hypothetical protein
MILSLGQTTGLLQNITRKKIDEEMEKADILRLYNPK